jgi:hypothetical protein
MLSNAQREHVSSATRVIQIIVAALILGVLFFFAIVVGLHASGEQDQPPVAGQQVLITYVGILAAPGAVAMSMVIPGLIASHMRQAVVSGNPPRWQSNVDNLAEIGDAGALTAVYQTRTIIRCSLLEGAAFLNLVAYMVESKTLSVGIVVVLLALLAVQIPTRSRVIDWVESELNTVKGLRQVERR